MSLTLVTHASLVLCALAQAPPTSPPETPARDPAAERLELMKNSVTIYSFTREAGPLTLQPEPAFRLGKQGGGGAGVLEGAIFLWNDAVGRPEAAAQVFLNRVQGRPEGMWLHEFTSLSTGTFQANEDRATRWSPATPGVVFKALPGAPKPAATPNQRLRQMRALASEFKAEDDFGNHGTYEVLRLLTTPVARYGKPGAMPEDGALFAFVEGTDPEVFLFIEQRRGATGDEWQYACAPMSCWPLKVAHKGTNVWQVPLRSTENPTKPFFSRQYIPNRYVRPDRAN